jgi:hypothetical protein
MRVFTVVLFTAFASLYVGASAILLRSVKGFRSRLRVAYTVIVIGFITQSLIHIGETLSEYLGWTGKGWFEGAKAIGYTVAPLLIYFGTKGFSRLLQVKSFGASFAVAACSGLFISVAAGYFGPDSPDGAINFELVGPTFITWLLWMATMTLLQIRRQASQIYRPPVLWLSCTVALLALGATVFIVDLLTPVHLLIRTAPYVFGGVALCRCAYEFYKIRNQHLIELKAAGHMESSIDVVQYVASLVANEAFVNPRLDELRMLTARLSAGQAPSVADQQALKALYIEIEAYITTQDTVRVYDRSAIRELITRKLQESNTTQKTFWPELTTT